MAKGTSQAWMRYASNKHAEQSWPLAHVTRTLPPRLSAFCTNPMAIEYSSNNVFCGALDPPATRTRQ